MSDRQIDIRTASYRLLRETPGHATYGVWVNGGKCGDLVVRQSERVAFEHMLVRGGFVSPQQLDYDNAPTDPHHGGKIWTD